MKNLPKQIEKAIDEIKLSGTFDATVFIACAGENDVSNNIPMDSIMDSFQDAVEAIFSSSISTCSKRPHLVFIGPKVEPWMAENEIDARKKYLQLSERLNASIEKSCLTISEQHVKNDHDNDHGHDGKNIISLNQEDCEEDGHSIFYLDSLTLFCGESEEFSVAGGSAMADERYFKEDGLHLSDEGYKIWKEEVENIISKLICDEGCKESLDNSYNGRVLL